MRDGWLKLMVSVLTLAVVFILAGCSEETTQNAPTKSVKRPAKASKKAQVTPVEKGEEPEAFAYSSVGQRDPFESLLKKEKEARDAGIPKTPLEKFDLGQFRIQAILIGKGAPRAMVSAPDGKNYILKPGLKIGKNNGKIKTITKTAVIVEESTIDLAGNVLRGLQSITVPVDEKY